MASPLSIRLDGAARTRGIGPATCRRDLAAAEARRIRRERIRERSRRLAAIRARIGIAPGL